MLPQPLPSSPTSLHHWALLLHRSLLLYQAWLRHRALPRHRALHVRPSHHQLSITLLPRFLQLPDLDLCRARFKRRSSTRNTHLKEET